MKIAHKKDCLKDCDYDISEYILHDDYYQITKQFIEKPKHLLIKFRWIFFSVAIPEWILLIALCVLAIYYLNLYQDTNNTVVKYQIYGIVRWVVTLGSGGIVFIGLLWYILHFTNKFNNAFLKLVVMGWIEPNLNTYPHLVMNVLFILGDSAYYDFNNFWIVTTDWEIYGFALFFAKLNEYYLQHHTINVPLIANH